MLWNTKSGQKDYIWSKRFGYCMVTSNYNNNLIAAAEYGLNPECHIYKYPSKEIIHKFAIDTTVKCISMAFSRDGNYLLIIGGVPDFRLSIFDLQSGKKISFSETLLPCKPEEFIQCKFNPQNKNKFAILSQNTLFSYTLHPAYSVDEVAQEKILVSSYRLECVTYKPEEPELILTRCIWDQYSRIHICTDQNKFITLNSQNAELEAVINTSSRPCSLILTQKHIIVSLEEGMLQWMKIEIPPEIIATGDKEKPDQSLKILYEEIEQEWAFGKTVGESEVPDFISFMHYSSSFQTLICGTESGVFGKLQIEAEAINEEEEEEENQQAKEKAVLTQPFIELGRYHTQRVTGVRELGDTTQLVTICDDHYMNIWEATTQEVLASVFQPAKPTGLDVSKDGTTSFVGTALGAFRVYDVRERSSPKLVQQLRFFEEQIPIDIILSSADGRAVLVASSQAKQIFIISQRADDKYRVLGYFEFPGKVLSACFARIDGTQRILAVLHNNLLVGAFVPTSQSENPMEAIPKEDARARFRIIDQGTQKIMFCEATGAIIATGIDKLLKIYNYPQLEIDSIDWRKSPEAPVEEHNSHSIGTSCWHESKEFKFFVTGGKDGQLIMRNVSNFSQMNQPIKAHAVHSGGVTAICFSQLRSTIYSAGGDGSVMAWTVGGKPNPNKPIQGDPSIGLALNNMEIVQRVPGSQIKLYKQILQEEFTRQQEAAKQAFKDSMMQELSRIRGGLLELLAENERCTEIEKLERDEFVIDVSRKDKVEATGKDECDSIRAEAKKTVLRLQLLRDRLKQQTWDTMQTQQKAIKSIQSDTLIFNYPVRKRSKAENRRLMQIIYARKIELNEKLNAIENNIVEVINDCEFTSGGGGSIDKNFVEQYFMNRVRGKPKYVDDDCIQEAAQEYLKRDAEKKADKEKVAQSMLMAQTTTGGAPQVGKKKPKIKITKGKLGTKTKKKDNDDDEAARLAAMKRQSIEIRGMEEMHWKINYQIQQLEKLRKKIDMHQKGDTGKKKGDDEDDGPLTVLDVLYEPFEMYTEVRKRHQIELIKGVIFEQKIDFNKEFQELEDEKSEQVYAIEEKNKQIVELLENLGTNEELFKPETHLLEKPEHILEVKEDEVKVERYLTKEQREALEEERRKQAEREAALKGDNVGQRGLQTMLGTTELILKKDKGGLETELVREEWMNKPEDDMTEEEIAKLREFEQKEKDLKEKLRKGWEQELKKTKQEIQDIQMKFEERLRTLFKKKLFIDARNLEQELFIIRLVIMLHDGKETRIDEKKYRREISRLESEKMNKEELINNFGTFLQDQETQLQDQEGIRDQEKAIKRDFAEYAQSMKAILAFVRSGKAKRPNLNNEVTQREQELSAGIVDLDPFSKIDRVRVQEILKQEEDREYYDYDRDNVGGMTETDFEKLTLERATRVEMDKAKETIEKKISTLQDYINFLEQEFNNVEENLQLQVIGQKKASERINKIRYNFESIVYLKQGQVEVPQLPVATDYKDAILVQKNVINDENKHIKLRGNEKVELLKAISTFKTKLRRVDFQNKRLLLEVIDFEQRAMDVQMYRVTKQTQEIIQGKHQKKDEDDKKRLENQMKQLTDNTEERIKTIMKTRAKKQREINEKKAESEELEAKARELQSNVEQRMQIINLKSNTQQSDDGDPSKKIKEIAHKRKLLDILKQQTEEMEVLRDELDRLRAKTFPSFAHLHNKPGYPDEN